MRYLAVRQIQGSKEIVGIVELPDDAYARRVYRHPDVDNLTSNEISEAEYSTYKEFELVPVYTWMPVKDEKDYVDIYDPEFFYTDGEEVYHKVELEPEVKAQVVLDV